jgi:hypothetical protein
MRKPNAASHEVIGAAIQVHRELGASVRESAVDACIPPTPQARIARSTPGAFAGRLSGSRAARFIPRRFHRRKLPAG